MAKPIPTIDPWNRDSWSEDEAIAMLNLKGQPREWERVKKYADVLPGNNYSGAQLLRIRDALKATDREPIRRMDGVKLK